VASVVGSISTLPHLVCVTKHVFTSHRDVTRSERSRSNITFKKTLHVLHNLVH